MESFFEKPTPRRVVEHIYNQIILEHETGGGFYRYQLPPRVSISFANEVVERLCEYIHDADIIELNHGWIMIEWS
jgi:hypothetical protein